MLKRIENKKWQEWIRTHLPVILLSLVVVAIALANLVWLALETRPPHWDMARHLFTSLDYWNSLTQGKVGQVMTQYRYYPPFLYWLTMPFYLLFGISVKAAVQVNTVFIAVLVFSTYGIGRRLWGRRVGVLAAIMTVSTPMIVSQFKEYQLDAPLTAMVALCIYLLIRTEEFASRKYSVIFGFVVGLCLLTNSTTPVILGYALALALYRVMRGSKKGELLNVALAGMMAYIVSSFWYLTNFHQLKIDLLVNGGSQGALEGDPVVGSLASNVWYLKNILANQLQIGFVVLLTVGVVYLVIKKPEALKKNVYPILTVVGVLLIFTLLRNKDARYTLPMISSLSILSVYWISYLNSTARKIASISLVVYCTIVFWLVSFGVPFLAQDLTLNVQGVPITVYAQRGYIIGHPTSEDWGQEEVFKRASSEGTGKKLYYEGLDSMWFNNWGMNYYASRYGVVLVGTKPGADYILVRSNPGVFQAQDKSANSILSRVLPDGTKLMMYKNGRK